LTLVTVPSATADFSPATASLRGLDAVNFFLAGALAGFGPYVAVYLAAQNWTQENIGFVLSAGALAGLLGQVPGGELLDSTRSKRAMVALGVLVLALSAIIIQFRPDFSLVLIGLTLQGMTGGILGPVIVAISLGLVGHAALPERLGRNQRFASTGSLSAAGLMGLIGYVFSYRAIFLLVVAAHPASDGCSRAHPCNRHSFRSLLRSAATPYARSARAIWPGEPVEESGDAGSRSRPVLVSTRQCVDIATRGRGSHIS
jgi:MFS family permease